MSTSKSPDRLVAFTDAVVAIAMTLLVLPLTDEAARLVAAHGRPVEAVTRNGWQIFSFLLSFAVIARVWIGHHRLFAEVKEYSFPLILVNLCWLLTIVVLPFSTEMIGGFGGDRFSVLFYIGTILAGSACQAVMVLIIRRDENLARSPGGISDRWRMNAIGTTVALAAAMLLAGLVPAIGIYALLLATLPPLIAHLRYPRGGAETAAGPG